MLKKYGGIGLLLVLSGCTFPPAPAPTAPEVERQVVQIETADIQVIQHGDRLTMIIPTDAYFEPMKGIVRANRRENLRQMAQFTKNFADRYPRSVIRVTGYTDQVLSQQTQLKLSESYAETVAAYLFNAGVDTDRLAVQGRGSREPVAGEIEPGSMALNRRVVVQVN